MINEKELRIGNILHYTTAEGDVLPTTLDWQDLKWISEDTMFFNLVHEPIQLTEEILLKSGFHDTGNSYYIKGLILDHWTGGIRHGRREVESVHQLQNLYHALTGEELEMEI